MVQRIPTVVTNPNYPPVSGLLRVVERFGLEGAIPEWCLSLAALDDALCRSVLESAGVDLELLQVCLTTASSGGSTQSGVHAMRSPGRTELCVSPGFADRAFGRAEILAAMQTAHPIDALDLFVSSSLDINAVTAGALRDQGISPDEMLQRVRRATDRYLELDLARFGPPTYSEYHDPMTLHGVTAQQLRETLKRRFGLEGWILAQRPDGTVLLFISVDSDKSEFVRVVQETSPTARVL